MLSGSATAQAIACVPGAIPANERAAHFALAAKLFREQAICRTPLGNGYEIQLPVETLASVAQFVKNERLCCPFMRFDIEMQAGADALVLRLTGPEGAREVLDAELNLDKCKPSGCGCAA